MAVNVIFYCGYAAKWISTVEPFRSLLLGYPIDFIENQLNIFSQGISDSTIDAIRIPLKPSVQLATQSTISTPSATGVYSAATQSVLQSDPVLVSIAQAEAAFPSRSPYSRASPNITLKEESITAKDDKKVVTKIRVTNSAPGSYLNANDLKRAVLCVPTYWIMRQLWDMCSQADDRGNPTYPVIGFVNGKLDTIENIIPDFVNNLVTDYLKITYRCYFWALNFNNKSFDNYANNTANPNSNRIRIILSTLKVGLVDYAKDKNIFNVNEDKAVDYSYYVDAAAYYKALYDNNHNDKSDMFMKPNSVACEPKCGTIGTNKVATTQNPIVDFGRRYPPCAPGCGKGVFCLNKSPNTVSRSFLYNGRDSVDPTGYVFCSVGTGGGSSGTDNIKFVIVPPIPEPPPPPPPSVSARPLPRLSTIDQPNGTNPTVQIKENQTFLCEDRSLRNIYKYTLAAVNGPNQPKVPSKLPYQSLGIAATYTEGMDIASSTWVWQNSLDGIVLKCKDLPIDNTTPSITCPKGQNCAPPPAASAFQHVFPPSKAGPDSGPPNSSNNSDYDEEEPESDGSLFASMGSSFICACIVFTCISGILVLVVVMMGKSAAAPAAK
jgi:disulfide bond formation protein DsbB